MTFELPIAGSTIAYFAAGLAALTVVAYILKMRRRRFEVPFSALWQRVLKEKQTTSLWRKLKRILSLLLQLLILGLLVLAVADPHLGSAPENAKHVVVIVDASASMKAKDAGQDGTELRIDAGLRRAHELVSSLGGGDAAMIMRMDGRTTPMTRFETDKAALHRAIDAIHANDTPADLRRALTAAADALHDLDNPLIVIIGDGAYPDDVLGDAVWDPIPPTADFAAKRLSAIELAGIDVRYLPVGASGDNVGIVAFNVRRYVANKLSYEVFIEVQNFAAASAGVELTLYNGDSAIDVKTFALKPGEKVRQIFPDLGGGDGHRLRAVARTVRTDTGEWVRDVFPLDNEAYALLPERRRQVVLLVTKDNLYIEAAMLVYDNIVINKVTPEEYAATVGSSLPKHDLYVFDNYTPPPTKLPDQGHLVYFNPQGDDSPFPIVGKLERPRVTDTTDHHPVMKWVELGDVNFDTCSIFEIDRDRGDVSLARSIRSTLIAAGKQGGRKTVVFGFDIAATDLVLRVAFPLLLVNTIDWLAGDDSDLITTYETGKRFRVPIDAHYGAREVEVRGPTGGKGRAPVADGIATFFGTDIGIHKLTARDDRNVTARVELAANLSNPYESDIRPQEKLTLGGRDIAEPEAFGSSRRRSIWIYLVLLALVLLGAEWFTYNRRITV